MKFAIYIIRNAKQGLFKRMVVNGSDNFVK